MIDELPVTLVGSGPVVMVDDDDIDIRLARMVHERSLVENEFISFQDGPSFLTYLEECTSTGVVPSVVLLDINMPGMDGFEVLGEMRSRTAFKEVPVAFFYSNSDSPLDQERARTYGTFVQRKFITFEDGIEFFNSMIAS